MQKINHFEIFQEADWNAIWVKFPMIRRQPRSKGFWKALETKLD